MKQAWILCVQIIRELLLCDAQKLKQILVFSNCIFANWCWCHYNLLQGISVCYKGLIVFKLVRI